MTLANLNALAGLTLVADLDNTTQRYNHGIAGVVFETTGRVVPTSCPSYNFAESGWFGSTEEFLAVHAAAVADGLFLDLETYDGAAETIAALRAAGVTVKIATHRLMPGLDEDVVKATTVAGLAARGIEYDEIHFVKNKYEVAGDVYIDDAPYVIESLDERGLARIVFDQEYNRQYAGPRATAWADVPALMRQSLASATAA